MNENILAILNGEKIRKTEMPPRYSFGNEELQQIESVFNYYRQARSDIGYQGYFEDLYCRDFANFLGYGEGYCDAVNSGTNALFIALRSLRLEEGAHVLVSPVTDPGTLSAIIMNKLVPVVVDSFSNSFNISVEEVEARYTDKVKVIMVVHLGGQASKIEEIVSFAQKKNVFVIEDCSQAHGAAFRGRKVGTFGDIGVFSTMFSKSHSTGGNGGVIFTKSYDLYKQFRSHADRGKDFFNPNFDSKDPSSSLFPALNFNQDEISCAIGIASLKKLPYVNKTRVNFLIELSKRIRSESSVCKLQEVSQDDAPFFWPIEVAVEKINCTKIEFAEAIKAEGVGVNPHYKFIVSSWPWIKDYLSDQFKPKNAINFQNKSFNLLFNEKYGSTELNDIVNAILKVERYYLKK